jgi:CRISPR-associated protein Cas2
MRKRVGMLLKLMRRYLNWIQNSVFEGELTAAKLEALKCNAKVIKETNSVIDLMNGIAIYKVKDSV